MSIQLIERYHEEIKRKRNAGAVNEQSLRNSFYNLIDQYARPHNLDLIAELGYRVAGQKNLVYPDGTLRDALQNNWGFWESKDTKDDLDQEIANKTAVGYPLSNTLFEDTQTAVLFQANAEVGRVDILNANALHELLTKFVSYESPEVRAFREAIERFSQDVPALAQELRAIMRQQYQQNKAFKQEAQAFLKLCQESINPSLEMADIREMMVQHVLTQDIFLTIFDEVQFHQENNIAQRLGQVVRTFYKGAQRKQIEGKIGVYYNVIKSRASQIADHHEKQRFLKVLYETFYKAYNPKAADRLGIVYTPNEIVRFMVEATDTLLHQQFGRGLGAPNVHILDPATGTGTYITELIEYLPPHQLQQKYDHELHCNEVSILPYYIANLNIEYSYQQKMGHYRPFNNAVFVDTLDNMGFGYTGKQLSLFALAEENLERIRAQNEREISVIIGNPPYNANQLNENENNKNREYPAIDKRIKETYVKQSTAQKTKVYDMYARFYRWATDRLGEDGVIAFVTNRSFINARTFDGFRKMVSQEFDTIYVLDLGGDVRANPKLSGPKHNVFAIQTGVAICFLVRKQQTPQGQPAHIYYARRPEMETAKEKLAYLNHTTFQRIPWQLLQPDKNHNWINLTDNDWDDLLPIADKEFKQGKDDADKAVFRLFSLGVATNRDEWVYDHDKEMLEEKINYFIKIHNEDVKKFGGKVKYDEVPEVVNPIIKWTRATKRDLVNSLTYKYSVKNIYSTLYRPFFNINLYFDNYLNEMRYQLPSIFPSNQHENRVITFNYGSPVFACFSTNKLFDLCFIKVGNGGTQGVPLYRYDELGNQQENITDWALAQFRARYANTLSPSDLRSATPLPTERGELSPPVGGDGEPKVRQRGSIGGGELGNLSPITKPDIFHYVYAVLHHPAYRQKYKLNLKREFPRIPFYDDFWQWANWGQQLLALHLHYETIDPYPLHQEEKDPEKVRTAYKAKLQAQPDKGIIILDTYTSLHGVPAEAWGYKLGNRSAIEWVLDRYKERKPRDPTIRERFNTYRFLDYKPEVIELLGQVVRVSVETQAIIAQMPS